MEQVAQALRRTADAGQQAVVGRVIALKGFSTLPVDEMVVIDEDGRLHGDLLGRPGAEKLTAAAKDLFQGARLETVGVSIHGPEVKELGLSCGGQADVLLQPAASIPAEFWDAVARRAPVALVTIIDGPGAGPGAVAFGPDGAEWGALTTAVDGEVRQSFADAARSLLREGRTGSTRLETEAGVALVEAWVPTPRLVVVGGGDIAGAIEAQAGLLGWETRATDGPGAGDQLEQLLDWAGATAALIVTSHDPHIDAPALAAGLARPIPYIGAMGSRGTQSRRLERLAAQGIPEEQLDRIHRPIGLNLGGRRAPEVALAIVAEILSVHCGRDGRPLKETTGPIHG
ncbi:MAG TPA: XdhC family protein [Acidimicrobiales bacterium]|nr:XdhC family protein [Acidimicrobiales bacterium]